MALPNGTGKRFIRSKLLNDTTLQGLIGSRVYEDGMVPAGATMPYVVYQIMPGTSLKATGKYRIWNDDLWLVKCIGKLTQMATIEQIANRVDDLLAFTKGEVSTGTVVVCEHERPIEYKETDDEGQTYEHLGAEYSLKIQAGVVA